MPQEPRHASGIRCKTHKTYSLDCNEYEQLWERAQGCCEACGQPIKLDRRDHAIDHDHRYGHQAVRGIVCYPCNINLGQIEAQNTHLRWAHWPGYRFSNYFSRAWFTRHLRDEAVEVEHIDRATVRNALRTWNFHNKHLISRDPKAVLVPTNRPSEIAQILRREMSPQAYASLVRVLNKLGEQPKRDL